MSAPHYFQADQLPSSSRESLDVEVAVYGGTAAGVIAALTLVERNRSVVLLHPGKHLGGMTTGGLGWTDFGRKYSIGGRSRAFYRAIGKQFGVEEEWCFPPSAAKNVLEQWIDSATPDIRTQQFLDTVELREGRIHAATFLGGLRVSAARWIDATYEGDLMAKAGVSHAVGRESNEPYGETLNGIQVRDTHQFTGPVDPFVTPGKPDSGLLPNIENVDLRPWTGKSDRRMQAYNFRVCMTNDPDLKIDWKRPENYDPLAYELGIRWLQNEKDSYNELLIAGRELVPAKFDILTHPTPGGFAKTDTNNHGAVSSDFIGGNWDWPEADYARREELFQAHVRHQFGLYWTFANDDRVPEPYRRAFAHWGLAADEFTDSGNLPHQLYVREGRRLVGDVVITEHHCLGKQSVEDPVGLGSYSMDSHNCTRFTAEGRVWNEGDVQVPLPGPYGISYRSIIPKRGECENLLVPVCASTSHIAFGSLRMEPVFMVLAESAAIAADISLSKGISQQDVAYADLRPALDDAGQVLKG